MKTYLRKKEIHAKIFKKQESPIKFKVSATTRAQNNKSEVMPGVTTDDEGKPIPIVPIKNFSKKLTITVGSSIDTEPSEIISDPYEI